MLMSPCFLNLKSVVNIVTFFIVCNNPLDFSWDRKSVQQWSSWCFLRMSKTVSVLNRGNRCQNRGNKRLESLKTPIYTHTCIYKDLIGNHDSVIMRYDQMKVASLESCFPTFLFFPKPFCPVMTEAFPFFYLFIFYRGEVHHWWEHRKSLWSYWGGSACCSHQTLPQ